MAVTRDGKYAFVIGFNRFVPLVPSQDPTVNLNDPGGSTIGVIRDPLTNPVLVAATRPIPISFPDNIVLDRNDTYLYAAYRTIGAVFVYDVAKLIAEVEAQPPVVRHQTPINDLPLDVNGVPQHNAGIDIRASYDKVLVEENRVVFDVIDPARAPIGTGGLPQGLDTFIGSENIPPTHNLQDVVFTKDSDDFTFTITNNEDLISATSLRVDIEVFYPGSKQIDRFLDYRGRTLGRRLTLRVAPLQTKDFTIQAGDVIAELRRATRRGRNLLRNFERDVLLGAELKIKISDLNNPSNVRYDDSVFVYRLLDIADDNHGDAQLNLARTLVDGEDNVVRERKIDYRIVPGGEPIAFEVSPAAGQTLYFSATTTALSATITYDPLAASGSSVHLGKLRLRTANDELSDEIELGAQSLQHKVFLNRDQLADELDDHTEYSTDQINMIIQDVLDYVEQKFAVLARVRSHSSMMSTTSRTATAGWPIAIRRTSTIAAANHR